MARPPNRAPIDNSVFDASQYAFFGKSAVEEVDLGGLEEEEVTLAGSGSRNDGYHLFDKDEVQDVGLESLADVDDLATTFSKLNRNVTGTRNPGVIGDRGSGSLSRENSSAADWPCDSWLDHQSSLDVENALESKRWSSHPHPLSGHPGDFKPLHRALSYPDQQLQQQHIQQHFPSETLSTPKSSFTSSFPSSGGRLQHPLSHHHSLPVNIPDLAFSTPNSSVMSDSSVHLSGRSNSHGFCYGGNKSMLSPAHGISNQPQNQWSNYAGLLHGDHSMVLNNVLHQQLALRNGLISSPHLSPRQQLLHGLHQPMSSMADIHFLRSQIAASHSSPPPHLFKKYDTMYGIAEMREQRPKSNRGKHRFSYQQGAEPIVQKNEGLQFRSKYMTSEELESVLKPQHSSHSSSDPYVDDYYHQACAAKKSSGSRLKQHFAPLHLRDLPSRVRSSSSDQHGHQSLDTLRKLALSSIRKPRPLLDIELPSSGCGDVSGERRLLEQEPLFAARIAVEDAYSLLLDVDDIDRFLQFSSPQDGGSQLRRKRLVLLEALIAALQLVDPLGGSGGAHTGGSPEDDIVFMRFISLPKGRKFLSRFLELLTVSPDPAGEQSRIVCMAVFRHLRSLFGGGPSSEQQSAGTEYLAKVVSTCVSGMDLRGLSACLAAVVCSSEQPPLRPLGSPSGDHASLILRSLLETANQLLTNPPDAHTAGSCSTIIPNLNFWKVSFSTFFTLLTKYCSSKYDTIMQSSKSGITTSSEAEEAAATAIRREMPVELLRASLPHTNEHQRGMLMNFANHQSVPFPISGFNHHDEEKNVHLTSEFIRS